MVKPVTTPPAEVIRYRRGSVAHRIVSDTDHKTMCGRRVDQGRRMTWEAYVKTTGTMSSCLLCFGRLTFREPTANFEDFRS